MIDYHRYTFILNMHICCLQILTPAISASQRWFRSPSKKDQQVVISQGETANFGLPSAFPGFGIAGIRRFPLIKIHGPFANIIGISQSFQQIDNDSSVNFRQSLTRILQIKLEVSIRSIVCLKYNYCSQSHNNTVNHRLWLHLMKPCDPL
jgi:hypothetical protein